MGTVTQHRYWWETYDGRMGSHMYSGVRMVMKYGVNYTLTELQDRLDPFMDEVVWLLGLMIGDGMIEVVDVGVYTLTEEGAKLP